MRSPMATLRNGRTSGSGAREGELATGSGFARGSGTSMADARSQAATKKRTMESDFFTLGSHEPFQGDLDFCCRVVHLVCSGFHIVGQYLKRVAAHGRSVSPNKLFGKCLLEDAVVGHHGQPDHNDNKCYLRADANNDILFDPFVGMNPAMKSLKGPQRFVREVGVNSMERIGQHCPERAE
jgi:hypothetical protein